MKKLVTDEGLRKPMESDPKLKSYYCPYCEKLIMKGNVKKLSMVCSNCRKMIEADGDELVRE